jgi:uncharacterized LabA/DUF88 family protein
MNILVDHDNLEAIDRSRGLTNVALRIVEAVAARALSDGDRVNLRRYGGWYSRTTLSNRAQMLAAEIQREFPTVLTFGSAESPLRVRVAAELATCLLADPRNILHDTFRVRAGVANVAVAAQPWHDCAHPMSCPLIVQTQFLSTAGCPATSCAIVPETVLKRNEQKLVDTMLVADMIYAGMRDQKFAIVSSDDDMWPGIRSALVGGARVFHVHTKAGRATPVGYARTAGAAYHQFTL